MPVIKRYPNRKLYDTEAKQYITLEGIADLIRQGKEVCVVDHASGADLTAVTLTQIIFEQEKKYKGFLPQAVLTGLIQAGGDTMSTLRRTLTSSLNLAHTIDEEIERRIQALVHRGDLATDEGVRLRNKLLAHTALSLGTPKLSERDLEQALDKRGVPTRDDLKQILAQLDELALKLDSLSQRPESA
jgi:polyhydroxyalkanoate synthesis repressor PhaR